MTTKDLAAIAADYEGASSSKEKTRMELRFAIRARILEIVKECGIEDYKSFSKEANNIAHNIVNRIAY